MITYKYLIYIFIGLVTLSIVSCDTIQKTPTKSTSSRGATINGRNHTTTTTQRTNRTTTTPNTRGRTHTAVARTSSSNNARTPTTHKSNATKAPTKSTATTTTRGTGVATVRNTSTSIPAVVEIARTYTGTPYVFGGNDKSGIDCSGLICSVFTEAGYKVPRISWQQSEFGSEVAEMSLIKPGDWLFFVPEAGKEGYVSHSGIVTEVRGTSEIIFIHASTSKGVREDNLYSTYFKNRFVKAKRPF